MCLLIVCIEGGKGYFCDAVINHFCCLWILINWKTVLWIVIETRTTKILDCVHVHWRSIEENKLFIWTKDWFKFTFESFDVTEQSRAHPSTWPRSKVNNYTIRLVAHEMQNWCSWTLDQTPPTPIPCPPHVFVHRWKTFLHEEGMKEECVQEYAELFVKNRSLLYALIWKKRSIWKR